ncbi:helicase POLQ-like isoform X2 [Condylostylus longicornis]|uniref:helicase POLQ-like isoform X2 n=1 Tax=Condylostylus longicornis TaxID=2530218 RepID=UPI00244E1DD1|nr:helicase POLQ-like isoform X2 [Condylostylus longicornis]
MNVEIVNKNTKIKRNAKCSEIFDEKQKKKRRSSEEIFNILNNDDDSIFSKMNLPIQKKETNDIDIFLANEDLDLFCKNNENDVDPLQCTQKFFDDLNSAILLPNGVNNTSFLDHSKIYCGSQYQSRTNGCNISLIGSDSKWDTQIFEEETNLIPNKGPFYNLPVLVQDLIKEHKGIEKLYDWQNECLNLPAIKNRQNLIYALPTSGGKTLVSEILMLREIVCREKCVIFILPYVSIVQEKFSAMAPFALRLNFNVEEYAGGKGKCPPKNRHKRKTIYICSIEKGAILFNSLIEVGRVNEIGLIVVDELHLIGEKGRGAILENFLSKVIALNAGIQIIGMSATIGNISEISNFLKADVYTRGFRPVELKEYIKCGRDILSVNPYGNNHEDLFKFKKADPDHLAGLVSEVIPKHSCLIFCSTRKNCENVAILLTKVLSKKKYLEYRQEEKTMLLDALKKLCGNLNPILLETVPFGIAFHHSGLMTDERKLLEIAYRVGTLCVICCTSTLAAGVNLPAKRVIIRAPYVGKKFISLSQYKQMIGRAGRAGLGETGESILILSSKDNYKVGQMLSSPMDNVISAMTDNNYVGLENLVLSAIGLKISSSYENLLELVSCTLLATQKDRFEIKIPELISKILKSMFKKKILKIIDEKLRHHIKNYTSITISEETIKSQTLSNSGTIEESHEFHHKKKFVLRKSTRFELSTLGRAAYKAGISYEKAQRINSELELALKSLVLSNYSHLLYLVVALNSSENNIVTDPSVLFREFNNDSSSARDLFKVIGITDAHIIKMFKTMSFKGPLEVQLERIYIVLMLNDIINLMPLREISSKYSVEPGVIQNLLAQSSSSANTIIRLCGEIEKYWCYKPLLEKLNEKLDRCSSIELEALMQLPSVKNARAKQLYAAGFSSIEDIAKCKPTLLVKKIEHLHMKTAKEIVSAAKLILLGRLEDIESEASSILECLNN